MTYVALLRGINVGGRIIKKDELKACFEATGLTDVKTVLQSGNVVFSADSKPEVLKKRAEDALSKTFGFPAKVWVIDSEALERIIDANPFANSRPIITSTSFFLKATGNRNS